MAKRQSQLLRAFEHRVARVRRLAGQGEFEIADGQIGLFEDGRHVFKTGRIIVQFVFFHLGGTDLGFVPHDVADKNELDAPHILRLGLQKDRERKREEKPGRVKAWFSGIEADWHRAFVFLKICAER